MKLKKDLLVFVMIAAGTGARGAEFFVAPGGLPTGDGSALRPWDIQTALHQPATLRAGDTLWLRGGTYRAPATPGDGRTFYCSIIGTAAGPILVKGYPGENAVVDGGIRCEAGGSYVQFWNFRITNTDTNRVITSPEALRATGLLIESKAVKAINLVIDNVSTPILWTDSGWAGGDGGEIYGCLVWGSGIYDAYTPGYSVSNPWTRGNGIYAQNVKGQRFIRDCIVFRNFTGGILAYGEGSYANGFTMEGNISFDPAGGAAFECTTSDHPIQSITMVNNYAFSERPGNLFWVGYHADHNQGAVLVGNYAAGYGSWTTGLIAVKNFDSATIRSNTFFGWRANGSIASIDYKGGLGSFPFNWDYNNYYASNAAAFITNNALPQKTLGQWRSATGYDAHSTFTNASPGGVAQFTRRNRYDTNRAHLVVFNWSRQSHLAYNLTNAGFGVGQRYEIRDAQNYLGAPVLAGTVDGGPVSIPLQLTAVSPIVGTLRHFVNQHTPSTFNTFVLLASPGTNLPPALTIARSGNSVLLSCPAVDGWNLYSARSPGEPTAWSPVPGTPSVNAGRKWWTVTPAPGAVFYRLRRP